MALPTPAQVKSMPFGPALTAAFAAVADDKVQELIDNCAKWFGSAEAIAHTARDEAVRYGAAHLLYLALDAEGLVPGGGGGLNGPVSSRSLEGVGSVSYAVQAIDPGEVGDWLQQRSPFLAKLSRILETFPVGMATTG